MSRHMDELDERIHRVMALKAGSISAVGLDLPAGLRRARRRLVRNAMTTVAGLGLLIYGGFAVAAHLPSAAPKPAATPSPSTGRLIASIVVNPTGLAFDSGALWASIAEETPASETQGETPTPPAMIREPAPGRIVRIDPATRQITTTIDLPGDPWDIAAGFGAVWAPDRTRPVMYRIDEATGTISEIALPAPVLHVLAADGAIWTTSDEDRKGEFSPLVVRIDPSNSEVTATIPVDASELHELMTLGSRIFVETGTGLAEIDPSTNRIVRSIERTNGLFAASYAAADTIWEAACVPHGASEPKDKEKSAPCTWQVARIDPDSGDTITQAAVGHWVEPFPSDGVITQSVTVVGGDSTMWVLAFDLVATTGKPTEERTRLLQVDPANGKVLTTTVFRTTPRSIGLYELEIQDRAVWVAPGWEEVVETPLATR